MNDTTPRWIYRFDNFKRAYGLLREAIELSKTRPLTALEQEGVIQRFEYSWELAWKTLKDFLESGGMVLDIITPASVLRSSFSAGIIEDGDLWFKALETRNKMSHIYDGKKFEQAIHQIEENYIALFKQLYDKLSIEENK